MGRPYRAGVGVKGALLRGDRLLLLRRANHILHEPGAWDLPGGGVDRPDETLPEALRREFHEETGVDVTVGAPYHVWHGISRLRTGLTYPSILVFYRCTGRRRGDLLLDPNEHCDFAWVSVDQLSEYRLSPRLVEGARGAYRRTLRTVPESRNPRKAWGRNRVQGAGCPRPTLETVGIAWFSGHEGRVGGGGADLTLGGERRRRKPTTTPTTTTTPAIPPTRP